MIHLEAKLVPLDAPFSFFRAKILIPMREWSLVSVSHKMVSFRISEHSSVDHGMMDSFRNMTMIESNLLLRGDSVFEGI